MGLFETMYSQPETEQPQGIPPAVLQRLLALGTLAQRRNQLAQIQPPQVDYQHGKGLPLALSGLLSGLTQGLTAYKQKGLDQEQTQGRSALMSLAGNNPAMAAVASGDPVAGQVGQTLLAQPGLAAALRLHAAQAGKMEQEVQQAGPQEALGGQTPQVFEALTKRSQVPKVAVNPATGQTYDVHSGKVTGGGAPTALLSPEALDQNALNFVQTGQLPSVGMGAAGAAVRRQIINRAAEMNGGASIAGNKADYKANAGSLATLQKSADSIESFESTALKNLDAFLKTAGSVVDTGSPLFNRPLRSLDLRLLGSAKQTQFNTARQVAVQEIGKVLGGAVQGGAITDSQRHEVEGLLSGDASLAQITAAAETLKQDMANRKAAVHAQLDQVRGRLSGQPQAAAPEATAPTKVRKYNPETGTIE